MTEAIKPFLLPEGFATIDLSSPNGNPFSLVCSTEPNAYERGIIAGNDWGTGIVISALSRLLGETGILIDVGANIGVVSLALAADGFSVLSVEMLPMNSLKLQLACAINGFGNVRVVQSAASSVDSLLEIGGEHAWGQVGAGNQIATAMRLDTLMLLYSDTIARGSPRIVIKIDVEGHELEVIKGATELILRHRPAILFESIEFLTLGKNQTSKACKEYLESLGYRLFLQRRNILIPKTASDIQEGLVADFVAIPIEKPDILDAFEVRQLTRQERADWAAESSIEVEPALRLHAVHLIQTLHVEDPGIIPLTAGSLERLAQDPDDAVRNTVHAAGLAM